MLSPAEIRSKLFPNANVERYYYTTLLQRCVVWVSEKASLNKLQTNKPARILDRIAFMLYNAFTLDVAHFSGMFYIPDVSDVFTRVFRRLMCPSQWSTVWCVIDLEGDGNLLKNDSLPQ
jgi:hypothetical protein